MGIASLHDRLQACVGGYNVPNSLTPLQETKQDLCTLLGDSWVALSRATSALGMYDPTYTRPRSNLGLRGCPFWFKGGPGPRDKRTQILTTGNKGLLWVIV